MDLTLGVFFFLVGLIVGSFLNVVIFRYNAKKISGRSACMSCRSTLHWYELIPLISFLVQAGRCKNCQTKISLQYPLVEFITGVIFSLLFFKFQDVLFIAASTFAIIYLYHAVMFSLLIVIAVYDLKHKIIPDALAFAFGALAFSGLFFFAQNSFSDSFFSASSFFFHIPNLLDFLSGVFVALPFALLWLVSGGAWMGLGDAKLALGLGWFLGLSLSLSALVVAFFSGAIIGVGLLVFGKNYGMKSEIPFAPYLVLGTFLVFLFNLHLFNF